MRLLLKAVRSLPERDQDLVLGYLLQQRPLAAPSDPMVAAVLPSGPDIGPLSAAVSARVALSATSLPAGAGAQGNLSTLPVRFPEPLYHRLKEWCGEHNFPMAVVVRGLVERFLDEQQRPAS